MPVNKMLSGLALLLCSSLMANVAAETTSSPADINPCLDPSTGRTVSETGTLDLSSCNLEDTDIEALIAYIQAVIDTTATPIVELNLSGNSLTQLTASGSGRRALLPSDSIFAGLEDTLEVLDLSDNEIEDIGTGEFDGLDNLVAL
ncbi:unnamed protein product [Ectocarpus fasciculatus]